MNKVKVIKEILGIPVDTVLSLKDGKYEYNSITNDTYVDFDSESTESNDISVSLSKDVVKNHIGEYFQDITEYKTKSYEQVEKQIERYKTLLAKAKELDDEMATTVYQNLIWMLKWVIGE